MPFETEQRKGIPTSIGVTELLVTDNDGTQANATVMARAQILDEDGNPIRWTRQHNIGPDLTAAMRTNLWNVMTAIRNQATSQVIPPP